MKKHDTISIGNYLVLEQDIQVTNHLVTIELVPKNRTDKLNDS